MFVCNKSILHAIDTTGPGGAETVFLDLVEKLHIDGYKNYAIIKGPGWVEDQLKHRKIDYLILKPYGFLSIPYYFDLFKILRGRNTKMVHAHLLGSTLTYSILGLIARIPVIATLHGRVDVNPNERFVAVKNGIMKLGVKRLVAVSRDLASYIAERKLFKEKDIQVIYNGIEESRYGKNTNQSLRANLGIASDAILIGSLGNVRPAKSYDVLIRAAAVLIAEGKRKFHFVIAGHQKQDLMEKLQELIGHYNIEKNIHFIGFYNDTADFLGQMNYFALSSSSEGFSIATIEAMASGLPVVVTRCGGPEEIIEQEKTGLLVAVNDPESLAKGIAKIVENQEMANMLASAGRKHVEKVFSFAAMVDSYKKAYMNILGQVN
ncbi:MAG: glycosyltransferase [Cellvibrio sp.]|uniref:glycosyltransferase n=1 Tax=Cellvibrio sp. TaxID=1965322 RepID=UPI0031A00054